MRQRRRGVGVEDVLNGVCSKCFDSVEFSAPWRWVNWTDSPFCLLAEAWHVDSSHLFVGIKDLPCHFVTVFCPLYGMEEAIGPTEFILGSQHFTHWLPTLEVSDQYPPEETVELIRSEAKTWASDLGEGEIQMDCEAGDIVVMDGRLLHRAQANRLPESVRSLAYFSFCRPWYYEWPRSQAEDRFLFTK